MSKIILFLPDGTSRSITLQPGHIAIGRHPRNTIVLPDPKVSAAHAVLQRTESGWWIEDLSSTNGTWMNGRRVHASLLRQDDILELGTCVLRLLDDTPPASE
jgi:pSer/pThr/pTyr-binding forkhead associated (FHA) protein